MDKIKKYMTITLFDEGDNEIARGIISDVQFNSICVSVNSYEYKEDVNDITSMDIILNLYDKQEGLCIYSGVIDAIDEGSIFIKNIVFLFGKERRLRNRVVVKIPVQIKKIVKQKVKVVDLHKPMFMIAKNISMKGILLESDLNIPTDIELLFDLLLQKQSINLKTKIRRKYENNKRYYYGCEFNLDNKENREVLKNYITRLHNEKFHRYYGK